MAGAVGGASNALRREIHAIRSATNNPNFRGQDGPLTDLRTIYVTATRNWWQSIKAGVSSALTATSNWITDFAQSRTAMDIARAGSQAFEALPGMSIFRLAPAVAPFTNHANRTVARLTENYAGWSESRHPMGLQQTAVLTVADGAVGLGSSLARGVLAAPQMMADPLATVSGIASAAAGGYELLATHTTGELAGMAYSHLSSMSRTRISMGFGELASVFVPFAGEAPAAGVAERLSVAAEGLTGGSTYASRLAQTPVSNGAWSGLRGESTFVSTHPDVVPFTGNDGIAYATAYPDFFPVSAGQVEIPNMTASRSLNFAQADKAYADLSGLSVRDIKTWRQANGYTWHEVEDLRTMQLVPSPVNGKYGHIGGVGEINAGAIRR